MRLLLLLLSKRSLSSDAVVAVPVAVDAVAVNAVVVDAAAQTMMMRLHK